MTSFDSPIPDDSRPRGILSEADRNFLRGKKEYASEQSERDARYRIRQRLTNSFLDFSILYRFMDKRDKDQVFAPLSREPETFSELTEQPSEESISEMVEDAMFVAGVSDAIGFLYQETRGQTISFEDLLEEAVSDIENDRGFIVEDVEVNVEVKKRKPDTEVLLQRLNEGEGLTREEISTLIRSDEFDLTPEHLDEIFSKLAEDAVDEDEEE